MKERKRGKKRTFERHVLDEAHGDVAVPGKLDERRDLAVIDACKNESGQRVLSLVVNERK